MADLPHVAALRERLAREALGREIAAVDLSDPNRLRGARPEDLRAALTGFVFQSARRHGEVLFLQVSCGWHLVARPGQAGNLVVLDAGSPLPDHARLTLTFADGGRLVFDDPARAGWVELTDAPDVYIRTQNIDPDPGTPDPDA
jgi:formamidopyrimidine-DNA glycosylase